MLYYPYITKTYKWIQTPLFDFSNYDSEQMLFKCLVVTKYLYTLLSILIILESIENIYLCLLKCIFYENLLYFFVYIVDVIKNLVTVRIFVFP